MIVVFDGKIALPKLSPIVFGDTPGGFFAPKKIRGFNVYTHLTGYSELKTISRAPISRRTELNGSYMGAIASVKEAYLVFKEGAIANICFHRIEPDIRFFIGHDKKLALTSMVVNEMKTIEEALEYIYTKFDLPSNYFTVIDFSNKPTTKPKRKMKN